MSAIRTISSLLRPAPGVHRAAREIYRRLLRPAVLRRRAARLFSLFCGPGDLCFDVGANRGARTEVLLALGATVVAVEPQPALAAGLREAFGRSPRFRLVEAALGASRGRVPMYVSDVDVLSTLSPGWVEGCRRQPHLRHARWTETTVEMTTLDDLVARFGAPAFVKIDVEGLEADVLRGLSTAVPALSFEYTPWRADAASECLDLLRPFGPARFNVAPGEDMLLRFPRWLDADGIRRFCREQMPREPVYGDIYAVFG
jgi:FkbM family methyltransferase